MSQAPQGLAPGLARRVSKILDLRTESAEVLSALSALSTFYGKNTPSERRGLRTTIERRGTSLNQEYLTAADSVIQVLNLVQRDVEGLTTECRLAKEAISSARESTAGLLSDADRLQRETASNRKRGELVHHFLQQYQLSPAEVAALEAPEIREEFFQALAKVRSIHTNCKMLLRSHHQRAGLELMDAMSTHQEAAYERLCRWVQSECRSLGDQDAPEVAPMLQQASRALRERPVLFKYCATEVATTRHNALFQRFIAALTRGGPGGMPRPIEMHAHDPRRYLGDMLAWLHQSLASERELLVGLFGDDSRRDGLASGDFADSREGSGGDLAADMPRTALLLDRVFDSICRPLKVRVEQVLLGSPPLLLCFSLSQLLAFYTSLVDRLMGSSSLTHTLASCRQLAARVFHEQLKGFGDRLLRYPPPPPKDLSPPQQLSEALQQLSDIIASFEASYEAGEGETGEAEFAPILSAAVDPLLETIHRSSEALSTTAPTRVDSGSVDPSAQHVYLINCLSALEYVLAGHSSCSARSTELHKAMSSHLSTLVASHAGGVLQKSGLAEIADRMRIYKSGKSGGGENMAEDQALSPERVMQALKSFVNLLSQPQAQPEFRNLQVPRIRAAAVSQVATSLADTYELVHDSLSDPSCGYDPDVDFGHRASTEEIRTILGIL